jgi:hypothetical protein
MQSIMKVRLRIFFEGALLGNGGLGCVVTTRPDAIALHFGHNDVWDARIPDPPESDDDSGHHPQHRTEHDHDRLRHRQNDAPQSIGRRAPRRHHPGEKWPDGTTTAGCLRPLWPKCPAASRAASSPARASGIAGTTPRAFAVVPRFASTHCRAAPRDLRPDRPPLAAVTGAPHQ